MQSKKCSIKSYIRPKYSNSNIVHFNNHKNNLILKESEENNINEKMNESQEESEKKLMVKVKPISFSQQIN